MLEQFSRTELLIGKQGIEKLQSSKIAIFGLGGVGSYVVEGLARAGIGNFILIDNDIISESNINRQIIATTKTIGKAKVEVAKERILEINPLAKVETFQEFFCVENIKLFNKIKDVDYIVDAIDTISSKIELIVNAYNNNIPIISCMGTGNKLDPTKFEITDKYKTSVCPLAKAIRKRLKEIGIRKLKVLYSKEEPIKIEDNTKENMEMVKIKENELNNNKIIGSISFVPSVAGLIISGEVIKDIIKV